MTSIFPSSQGLLHEYYQTTADIIGIFWQFHKKMVELGYRPFAYCGKEAFNSNQAVVKERYGGNEPIDIIRAFASGVKQSMNESLRQFLLANKGIDFPNHAPIPDECKVFINEHVSRLVERAQSLGRNYSKSNLRGPEFTIGHAIGNGLEGGSMVPTQLEAIFGESMKSVYALLLSKIDISHNLEAQTHIGIAHSSEREGQDFNLLDQDNGIKREYLKELGYGDVFGCPSGMPVTQQTQEFLERDCGVTLQAKTMLQDLTLHLAPEFNTTVRDWYNGLDPQQKEEMVDQRSRDLLEGRIIRTIRGEDSLPISRCPYSRSKEG